MCTEFKKRQNFRLLLVKCFVEFACKKKKKKTKTIFIIINNGLDVKYLISLQRIFLMILYYHYNGYIYGQRRKSCIGKKSIQKNLEPKKNSNGD